MGRLVLAAALAAAGCQLTKPAEPPPPPSPAPPPIQEPIATGKFRFDPRA